MATISSTTTLLQDENPTVADNDNDNDNDNDTAVSAQEQEQVHVQAETRTSPSAARRMSRLWRRVVHRAGAGHRHHHDHGDAAFVHQRRSCATAATVMAAATVLARDANDSTHSHSNSNSTTSEPSVQDDEDDEDDDEEEEEAPTRTSPRSTSTTLLATHYNVSCDECGVMPIVGCRYKSIQRPNYDVCAACLQENYDAQDVQELFVVLEHNEIVRVPTVRAPTTMNTSSALLLQAPLPHEHHVETQPLGRSVTLHSLYELVEVLEDQDTSPLLTAAAGNRSSRSEVQDVSLYIGTPTQPHLATQVVQALHRNASILSMHIYIFGTEHATSTIQALAQGLEGNTSVTTVAWHIIVTAPNHHQHPLREVVVAPPPQQQQQQQQEQELELSPEACHALQHLVECPTHQIRFMFFKYNTVPQYHPTAVASTTRRLLRPNKSTATELELEHALFQGLLTTRLHTFRYEGPTPVSATNQRVAWNAMETNPHIYRIKATFAGSNNDNNDDNDDDNDTVMPNNKMDFWLEFLTLDKKHQWMKQWNNTTSSMVPLQQWAILEHALSLQQSCKTNTNVDDDDDAKVPILYHFLRQQPGWCLLPPQQSQKQSQARLLQVTNKTINNNARDQEIWV